ncbi:MAG: hypothetical protein LBK45_03150 [Tannerellaceae bacterium]|jgi:hypothetical protein|nr:hypothetical protein [Tannerellaceae bacterium]
MKKANLLTVFVLFSFCVLPLSAQVTIGAGEAPAAGSLLQLKEKEVTDDGPNATKGLEISRVQLTDENNLYPMFYDKSASGPTAGYKQNKVKLDKTHCGLVVYNTNNTKPFQKGLYVWNGSQWIAMGASSSPKWFYMPPVAFATGQSKKKETKDLYALYKAQFATPVFKSNSAPANIPYIPAADQLYYYVTYADPAVFTINSISDTGIMNYDVTAAATDASFINIVFVLK